MIACGRWRAIRIGCAVVRSIRQVGGLVSGADDDTLRVWDLATGEVVRMLDGHALGAHSCAIDPTGRWVVSVTWDGGIRVWELDSGNLFALLRVDGSVNSVAWVPNRLQFVAVGARGIYVFELILNQKKK
ncbi:MAG: hypothetical protein ABI618_12000 [Nitrospirota bacterium]